jgi:hypothetical protein
MIGAGAVPLVAQYFQPTRVIYRNPPSDEHRQQHDLQHANSEERGTERVPFFVKVVPSEPGPEAKHREEQKEKTEGRLADYTEALFYATLLLGLATLGLAFVAYRQMREARTAIEAAVRSADTAEKALTDLEAPQVFIKFIKSGVFITGANPPGYGLDQLKYSFVNHGRTPAIILNYGEEISPLKHGAGFPRARDPAHHFTEQIGWGLVVPPGGESDEIELNLLPILMTPASIMYNDTTNRIFMRAAVRYADVFGGVYASGFLFMYDNRVSRWVLTNADQEYNYRRKEP